MKPRNIAFIAALLLPVALAVPTRATSRWGQMNRLSFSQPVALPGVVLPAGSYTFEIATPTSSANVVRVTRDDTHRIYFAGFTELVRRPANRPPGELVTLGEAPAGEPLPIAVWYPAPGAQGHRFLYR
jgi:hypothetical protein